MKRMRLRQDKVRVRSWGEENEIKKIICKDKRSGRRKIN